jgi:probable rRNA maturation factor
MANQESVIDIELNQQTDHPVRRDRLIGAVRRIVHEAGIRQADISLAVVDNPTIHHLNRRHLDHDYPTDVLSFVFHRDQDRLEGEVIVCADMAAERAPEFGWSLEDELLLYVIHGALHLVGYDDKQADERHAMRDKERDYLRCFGLTPPAIDESPEKPAGATDQEPSGGNQLPSPSGKRAGGGGTADHEPSGGAGK